MNDATAARRDERTERGSAAAVLLAFFVIMTLLLLPFLPLLLALLEAVTLGTNRVEDLCRQIGIHDELSALYKTVFSWFR